MTGNTVLLGLALGQAQGLAALRSAVALAGYLAGAACGALLIGRAAKPTLWPPAVTTICAFELLILAALSVTTGTWTTMMAGLVSKLALAEPSGAEPRPGTGMQAAVVGV
jgi:uncharacterized membrane protein YoaK (UPF0700 family)